MDRVRIGTGSVSSGKLGVSLTGHDTHDKLRHWVHVLRKRPVSHNGIGIMVRVVAMRIVAVVAE